MIFLKQVLSAEIVHIIMLNRNGGKVLVRAGYKYSKYRVNENGTSNWRCVNWRKKCKGVISIYKSVSIFKCLCFDLKLLFTF